ncbi:MAG: hypothetical protein IJQ65_10295, partial [Kiritimatiellae bacterium]|nr:hypothetical protein [Kiritimatiellia bacterium]
VVYVCTFAFVGAVLALRRYRRAAPLSVAAALFFACVGTVVAQKGGGTNEPPRLAARPVRAAAQTPRPSAPAKVAKINARGAWRDSFLLDFGDDFLFPFGTNRLSSVEIFTQGYVRPSRRSSEIVADTGLRAAIVPGVSSISVELTPSNSWRVVWTDAAQNRDTNTLVSASIELMRSGDVAVTTNGVTRTIPRVHPNDLDDDGIPDALDANPGVCDGDFFGPQDALPPGANTNAYCWVDLVVHDADAEVVFSGDGYSDLADPHFMARAEVTNRVTILIGKGYEVTCDEAIECVGVSDEAIEVWNHDERSLHVRWPVMIEYIDGDEPQRGGSLLRSRGAALRGNGAPGGLSRRMRVVPDWLGGEFVWATNHCCGVSMSGFSLLWDCGGDCGCNGCEVRGDYVYDGYRIYAFGGSCGCVPPPAPDTPPGPTVSVSFSEKVLFYEDVFTNSLGIGVGPYCASNVVLSCSVYGGERGGALQLSLDDGGRLDMVDGDELPTGTVSIAPRETKSYSVVYESTRHSDAEDDITATATFTETLSGDEITAEDSTTVVKLSSFAAAQRPINQQRRELGVGEAVMIYLEPAIQFECSAMSGHARKSLSDIIYTAPKDGGNDYVYVNAKGVVHDIWYGIVEPGRFYTYVASTNVDAYAGESGGFSITFCRRLLPTYVSFANVQLLELPRTSTNAVGYYAQTSKAHLLDHGDHGAGEWIDVDERNRMYDTAGVEINNPPWLDGGSFTWPIPVAWRV